MPRPRRSQGRPGTKVFPDDWETSHAIVVRKTTTAACRILPPTVGITTPTLNDDLSYETVAPATALYDGAARVQVIQGTAATTETGGQSQSTTQYLVVIDREAASIPIGSLVMFSAATDPELLGTTRLYVKAADRGSLRWERDLYCVDDLSQLQEA